MEVEFYNIGQVNDDKLRFAVISASFEDRWIFVRHKQRDTWEIPGGHRKVNENIDCTAQRELFEETGAIDFKTKSICDYSVARETGKSFGRLFYADVTKLGELPDFEIGEVRLSDVLPEKLTYPGIQPFLFSQTLIYINKGLLVKR